MSNQNTTSSKKTDMQEKFAGGMIAVIGVVVFVMALQFPLGTAARMGPGFFPLILGALLVLMGFGIVLLDTPVDPKEEDSFVTFVRPRLRAILFLIIAPIAFALLIEPAGLVPAVFAAVFISAFGDPSVKFVRALILSASVAVFCALVFGVGLGLSIDLIG